MRLWCVNYDLKSSLNFCVLSKREYIKYVGGFYKFFQKNFLAKETIDLNMAQ